MKMAKKKKEEMLRKKKETCLKKYGVEYASQSKKVQAKAKETCLKKYGVENASQNEHIKAKIRKTNLKEYKKTIHLDLSELVKNKRLKMLKAMKIRIYPIIEQENLINKTIGCARFVYNTMLDIHNKRYKNGKKFLNYYDAKKFFIANIKSKYDWLYEVDKWALDFAISNLNQAFVNFFTRCKKKVKGKKGYPKFKSRYKAKWSYTTHFTNNNIELFDNYIKLPKLKKVKAIFTQQLPDDAIIKQVTITKDRDGKFYASINYEYEKQITNHKLQNGIGLDYSSTNFYIDSDNNLAPEHTKQYKHNERKLKRQQRRLSKKTLHSNNYNKQRIKIAKTQKYITNSRNDYLHKLSHELSKTYDYVVVEDLNIKGLIHQKDTRDNAWGRFTTFLNYKLNEQGKELIKVNRFFPSSKTCSNCGHINNDLTLKDRSWTCPHCHTEHDRDFNAAKNILNEGKRILHERLSA